MTRVILFAMLFIKLLAKACLFQVTKAQRLKGAEAFRDSHSRGSTSKQASGTSILLRRCLSVSRWHLETDIRGKISNNEDEVSSKTKVSAWNTPRLGGASFENSWFNFRNVSRTRFGSVRLRDSPGQNELFRHALLSQREKEKSSAPIIQQSRKSRFYFSLYFSRIVKIIVAMWWYDCVRNVIIKIRFIIVIKERRYRMDRAWEWNFIIIVARRNFCRTCKKKGQKINFLPFYGYIYFLSKNRNCCNVKQYSSPP